MTPRVMPGTREPQAVADDAPDHVGRRAPSARVSAAVAANPRVAPDLPHGVTEVVPQPGHHSLRKVSAGSTRVARRAGR
jgi:hypothetical protein